MLFLIKKTLKLNDWNIVFITWKWINPGDVCLFCQSLEPNQAQTQVTRSEGREILRQSDKEKEKKV